jgi:ribosomal protein L31E
MPGEDKIFKSPEEKKREETLVEEKPAGGIEEAKKKQELEKLEEKGKTPEAKPGLKPAAKPAAAPAAKPAAKPEAKPKEKEKEKKEGKPKREIVLQRFYTIPLAKAYAKPHSLRGNAAARMLREFLAKHFKVERGKVKIDLKVANAVRARGSRKPLKKISVNASKDKEGIVLAELRA